LEQASKYPLFYELEGEEEKLSMKLHFLTLTAHNHHGINILNETFSVLKDTITYYDPYQTGI